MFIIPNSLGIIQKQFNFAFKHDHLVFKIDKNFVSELLDIMLFTKYTNIDELDIIYC